MKRMIIYIINWIKLFISNYNNSDKNIPIEYPIGILIQILSQKIFFYTTIYNPVITKGDIGGDWDRSIKCEVNF